MRVKKRSRHRKAVKFYSTCFGFREPYKVLVDGTFVHHLLLHRLLPADDALRELLSASRATPLFTSKCVLAELRRLGKSHAEDFDAAQLLATASCEHDKVVSAVDCILSLVGDKNPEHYFVATQDSDLREKLREVPGVPVIYGLKNSLFIEQPSVQQRKFAQLDEEKRIHMEKSEFKKLLKASSEGKASGDGNAPGVAEKSKFKRNRAKGPNPLSCKKKKPKPQPSDAQNQEDIPLPAAPRLSASDVPDMLLHSISPTRCCPDCSSPWPWILVPPWCVSKPRVSASALLWLPARLPQRNSSGSASFGDRKDFGCSTRAP